MAPMDSYLGWKIDFANPPGAPAYLGPDSMQWRVFKNPIALGVGGIAAVLLEFADARIRSGVWDHSTYKVDPIGRSRRTGMAAMVGVYAPREAARRVIQGVTNMHARVEGKTPGGEAYHALDTELLDWVSATAGYGFLNAYDRFVTPLTDAEKQRFYTEGGAVSQLYGVKTTLRSDADFMAMMEKLAPRFEPHPIVREFLDIIENGAGLAGLPRSLSRQFARASVSLLPKIVREKLELGPEYDLSPMGARVVRGLGALSDRIPVTSAPPAQACVRMGLPANFLYRSRKTQARLLEAWTAPEAVAAE
ncbi:MAG: oxygenase MpaB family protein [Alphaproteobacteria bacterium]|nr:oxygenase MpaB family protein [Alphaproteobacteria bacterium]